MAGRWGMTSLASVRVYGELNDFLPPERQQRRLYLRCDRPRSIRSIIDTLGIPGGDVDLIIVNGEAVTFSYRVAPQDRIAVYPEFRSIDVSDLKIPLALH